MKRLAAILPLILFLIPAIPFGAAGGFYCEYTPKSEKSSLFYIDVYSDYKVAGAVFELSFDDTIASFCSASAENSTASVRDYLQSGKVRIALADKAAFDGKLCRLSFKALQAGNVQFVLHMEQAVDSEKHPLSVPNDDTLLVKLGKADVASFGSGSRSAGASSRSAAVSNRGGGGSAVSYSDEDDPDSPYDAEEFDLRRDDSLVWMLIGAGIPVLMGILLWTGIVIGKRSKEPTQREKPVEDIPEPERKE